MGYHNQQLWAVILGGSSGFGLATAHLLAQQGMNVCVVHRDRRGGLERIEREFQKIRSLSVDFLSFNLDAIAPDGVRQVIDHLSRSLENGRVRLLLHSIAAGSVKLIAPCRASVQEGCTGMEEQPLHGEALLDDEELHRTLSAMGTSLLSWTRALFQAGLFADDGRVVGLTSEGNEVAWRGYMAVSAAKCVLEAISRSIAREFAPFGIRSNIVQPGVTDTPALRLIPGYEALIRSAMKRNPFGRLTQVDDVARVVSFLASPEASWINGTLIRVDGGERISG